jgi:hypothetical protein
MLPSSNLGTPRKRTTGGGSASGSSSGGSDAFGGGGVGADAAQPKGTPLGSKLGPRRSAAGTQNQRKMIALGAVGTVALIAIVAGVAGAMALRAKKAARPATAAALPSSGGGLLRASFLDAAYCQILPAEAQQYCLTYYNAPGNQRFAAASTWEKMSSITCAWGGSGASRGWKGRVGWRGVPQRRRQGPRREEVCEADAASRLQAALRRRRAACACYQDAGATLHVGFPLPVHSRAGPLPACLAARRQVLWHQHLLPQRRPEGQHDRQQVPPARGRRPLPAERDVRQGPVRRCVDRDASSRRGVAAVGAQMKWRAPAA